MSAHRQVVVSFAEGTQASKSSQFRGGKGAGLAEMAAIGLPIPPGFTIGTSVSRAFQEHGQLPKRLRGQLLREIKKLEQATGKGFGNPENPLLVSVRSGAAVSMPGMMDTVLNVGLNTSTLTGLTSQGGERFALDTQRRYLLQFGRLVLGLSGTDEAVIGYASHMLPEDPFEQLWLAVGAVLTSWQSERAVAYRNSQNVPHWWGTAINIQAMVFGNHDDNSGTGVVFSCNVASGRAGLYGEFLPNAQGEDVVSGTRTPLPIEEMAQWNPQVFEELSRYVEVLTCATGSIVDVEFTIEQGKLYILQSRKATRTPQAAVTFAVHQVWAKKWTKQQAVASVTQQEVDRLRQQEFDPDALEEASNSIMCVGRGLPASSGAAVGVIAYNTESAKALSAAGNKVVLVREDTTPDDLPGMLASVAIVTFTGGTTCHAAVVARGLGIPAVVATDGWELERGQEGKVISVDGSSGVIVAGELPFATPELSKEANIFLRWYSKLSYQPRIGFEFRHVEASANKLLNNFYLTSEMARAALDTSLEVPARALRDQVHHEAAERLACYLAIAIAGEARHQSSSYRLDVVQATEVLIKEFGINHPDRIPTQTRCIQILEQLTLADHIRFAGAAVTVFAEGVWRSGYGGSAWANIAKALLDYLDGTLPASLFVDRVYDLQHNGGRLFDKHIMLSRFTNEQRLKRQLDVKKNTTCLRQLHKALVVDAVLPLVSASVSDMFDQGSRQGLW